MKVDLPKATDTQRKAGAQEDFNPGTHMNKLRDFLMSEQPEIWSKIGNAPIKEAFEMLKKETGVDYTKCDIVDFVHDVIRYFKDLNTPDDAEESDQSQESS